MKLSNARSVAEEANRRYPFPHLPCPLARSISAKALSFEKARSYICSLANPMQTAAKSPPTGPAWVHEIKYDGYRMLCRITHQQARMVSRTGNDWTGDFDALARTLALLPVEDRKSVV